MTEPKHLKQAKDVIPFLKFQHETNKLSPTNLTDLCLTGTSGTDFKDGVKHRDTRTLEQPLRDSQCKIEFKLLDESVQQSSVTRLLNPVHTGDNTKKNFGVINTINAVKNQNKHKKLIGGSELKNNAATDYYTVNDNNRIIEIISDSSEEDIQNSQSNFFQRHNNKRFKTRHTISDKQSHLDKFYSVVKSVNNYEHVSKYSERLRNPLSNINKNENCINESEDSILTKVDTKGSIDFNDNKTIDQSCTSKFVSFQRKNGFKINNAHKITFNQLRSNVTGNCNGSMKEIRSKCDYTQNTTDAFSKGNMLFKFASTGNVTKRKDNYKQNSLPITSSEIKTVNQDFEKKKVTPDIFLEAIFKNIESKVHKNSDSDILKIDNNNRKIIVEPAEKNSDEEVLPIIQSFINHKELQASQHSQHLLHISGLGQTEKNETYDFSSRINISSRISDIQNKKHYTSNFCKGTETSMQRYNGRGIEDPSKTSTLNTILEGKVANKKEDSFEETCVDENDQSYTDENINCLVDQKGKTYINNALDSIHMSGNDLEKCVLATTNKLPLRSTEKEENNIEIDTFSLDNFLNTISNIKKENINTVSSEKNCVIKRYKKGKTKIYKLKSLKKKHLAVEEDNADLNFEDVLKNITDNYERKTTLPRSASASSLSTSSSYMTDNTKSDISSSTGSKELSSPQKRLRNCLNELSKDKSLCYCGTKWKDATQHEKEHIKMKIQDIFFQILDDFKKKKAPCFKHKRQSLNNCVFKDGRLQLKPDSESSMVVVSSKAKRSKAKFELMLYIMQKIKTLLETNTKITKRELYYQLKTLIKDQQVTDRAITAISCLLDKGMWAFNIIAQKGLVFGKLKLLLSSGETLNCNVPGTLIPLDINDIVEIHSSAYFILVVEKESIFHKLIEEDLPNKLTRPFIMITGKGFPDLNTQLFLRKLWMIMSIPVFILVDADPYGINIMLNYRFGSASNAHVSQHLAVPNAKWLGVYPSEMVNLNIARQPLNEKEVKMVNDMLKTPYMEFSPRLVDELNFLLTKNYKAGIEGLIKTDTYLSDVYLPYKFFTRNFI